jgi:hypothetical protein
MATRNRKRPGPHWIVRILPLRTLKDAQELAQRFREVEGIRFYVQERLALVLAASLVIGVIVVLANMHSLLALVGILLMPFALAGSFFVMAYVFFSWIEGRALVRELGNRHRRAPGAAAVWLSNKFGLDMGPRPPVPWFLAVCVLLAPLALLAAVWLSAAVVVILLGILMPVLYAKLDG